MTTTPCKAKSHKKARTISSGFLNLTNTFVLTPRQGLAGDNTSFRPIMLRHENDNSISVGDMASNPVHKPTAIRFVKYRPLGGAK